MKRWLHALGYINDPYLQTLFKPTKPATPIPGVEILQGYWARTIAVEHYTKKFINSHEKCQILSLGAGFDTLFFKVSNQNDQNGAKNNQISKYLELDLPSVIRRKIGMLKRSRLDQNFDANVYKMVGIDLCDLNRLKTVLEENLSQNIPTLVIAECLFMYLEPKIVSGILRTILEVTQNDPAKRQESDLALINYDSLNKNTQFSKNMIQNLQKNQEIKLHLNTYDEYKNMLVESEWLDIAKNAKFLTMREVFYTFPDRMRIVRILPLDDVEIFDQIMEHYYFVTFGPGA